MVTGASRGIGAAYARALAVKGYDLLLVSRDTSRLADLTAELKARDSVAVDIEALDLAQPEAAHRLYVAVRQRSSQVDMLINNAGFGMYGHFEAMLMTRIQEMLQLHVTTVVESIRLFLPSMVERQSGAIINVASLAGLLSLPYLAEYAATKSFLISFSEALAEEVRPSGVRIQACCPGQTATDFHATAGFQSRSPFLGHTAEEVVRTSLTALANGPAVVTVGWQGKLSAFLSRIMPRSMLIKAAAKRTKPPTSSCHENRRGP